MNKVNLQLSKLFIALLAISSQTANAVPNQAPNPALKHISIDHHFGVVAKEIAGFGGAFFDKNGDLSVYLTNPEDKDHAKKKLTEVFGAERLMSKAPEKGRGEDKRKFPAGEIRVLQAQYSFDELEQWRQDTTDVLAIEGTVFTDVDESKNRIVIGISDSSIQPQVESTMAFYGVPREAVVVTLVEAPKPLSTLNDTIRPIKGGLGIGYDGGRCTEGPSVQYGGVLYSAFLTASHCSNVFGGTDGTSYTQGYAYVGYEYIDPQFFGWNPFNELTYGCPWGWSCRLSDVSLVSADWAQTRLGRIAQPTLWNGSTTINPNAPEFTITSEEANPLIGQELDKVGAGTGWTYGVLRGTCQNIVVSGHVLLCQNRVEALSGTIALGGDSGAPVFHWSWSNNVALVGVLSQGNSTSYWYSPMNNIRDDFRYWSGYDSPFIYTH